MRLSGTKTGSANQYNGLGDQLYDLGGARPTLDLNFASNGSLVDSVTGKTLVTHTRASNATYVDGDGIIKDAVTNLLLYSEEFDNASWGKVGLLAFGSGSIANTTTAPDGTTTADLIVATTASGNHGVFIAWPGSSTRVVSVYVKPAGYSVVSFSSSTSIINFDLASETVSGTPVDFSSGLVVPMPNGWYRVSAIITSPAGGNLNLLINNGSGIAFAGDGTSGIYLWGAQVEQASTVGEYVKTTSTINSAPRFDHNPTTGESLGLLVEESRTNEFPDNTNIPGFFTGGSATRTGVTILTPDGDANGHAMLTDASAFGTNYESITTSGSDNEVDGTVSFYAKKKTAGTGTLTVTMEGGGVSRGFYAGAINSDTWTKVTATKDYAGATNLGRRYDIYLQSGNSSDGDTEFYICFLQFENGSFPTSYIRTEGSTVTRSADVTSIEGNDFGTFNLLEYSEEFDNAGWTKGRASITPNVVASPDNTFTADKFTPDTTTTTTHYMDQGATISGGTYTASIYLKQAGYQYGGFRLVNNSFGGDRFAVVVDLSDGTVTDTNSVNSPTPATYSVESVGNGWYRLSATLDHSSGGFYVTPFASPTATPSFSSGLPQFTGDGTSGIYVWGAQLEESSTATPYVKSDVTWTSRASNATYYDYTGTLRKSSYNQLVYSEEFDQIGSGKWLTVSISAFGSGSVANAITAPDGKLTADKIAATSGTVGPRFFQSTSGSGEWTFSVYAKAAEADCVFVSIYTGSIYKHLYYDLTNESVISATASSYSAVNVGNGWFRLSVTETTTSPYGNISFGLANDTFSSYSVDFTSDGTDGIYVWGAQLEAGPYAGDYAKTTSSAASSARNVAFLPDGSGNFVSAGELLLEDAGTNFLQYSENLVASPWQTPVGSTLSLSTELAPDGTATAYKYTETSSTNYLYYLNANPTTSTVATLSFWVKNISATNVDIGVLDTSPVSWIINPGHAGSNYISEINTNGWTRVERTFTVGSAPVHVYPIHGVNDGGELLIWGVQLETSSYPTSYIPTYGSTATRAADVSSSSSNTFGNSFYNQSEGAVFVNTRPQDLLSASFRSIWEVVSDNDNWITLERNGTYPQRGTLRSKVGGSQQYSLTPNQTSNETWNNDLFANVAIAYKEDSFANYSPNNGITASNGLVPNATELKIGPYTGAHFKRLAYWPTRLSNDTLQTITK